MSCRQVTVLGATGSIGQQTLAVMALHPNKFQAYALCANQNVEQLYQLCMTHQPKYAVMVDEPSGLALRQRLGEASSITVLIGSRALEEVAAASDVDIVMSGMVGAAGLLPTMAALQTGKQVLLANKESLVMGGPWMMEAAQKGGGVLLPVDSEHNAIFQALPTGYVVGDPLEEVTSLVLTASGGPFRQLPVADLAQVTREQALAHPNWSMGPKISIDSATMMNKGLEVIEAHWLFAMPLKKIEVVIHPQSVIHSLVRYRDGSLLAQLGVSDMRIPIGYALSWPTRQDTGVGDLALTTLGSLDFAPVDMKRYPCLQLAYQALQAGIEATIVLNAANEVAVQGFLNGCVDYLNISSVVDAVLQLERPDNLSGLEDALLLDKQARDQASKVLLRFQ